MLGAFLAVRHADAAWAAERAADEVVAAHLWRYSSLRETLDTVAHVDHHAHAIALRGPGTLNEFRGIFSLSRDPRQWQQHAATGVTYRRAIDVLASHLGCEPDERAVFDRRRCSDPGAYASGLLAAAGAEQILLDEGYPPPGVGVSRDELARLAGCPVRPVLRIESLVADEWAGAEQRVRAAVDGARRRGFSALKSVVAYRGGLDPAVMPAAARELLEAALDANERTGDPLPVQLHTGIGDSDLLLPSARPGYLKPWFERFTDTAFVLLHCYPFVREAGWLAAVYANVHLDLSLTIPHVSRPGAALAEAIELAPISKLLYASDGADEPELYLLAAIWWRDALAAVLPEALPPSQAEDAARRILAENARTLYRL